MRNLLVYSSLAPEIKTGKPGQPHNLPNKSTMFNIKKNKELVSVELFVPGFAKEDITVSTKDNHLIIDGNKTQTEAPVYVRKGFEMVTFKNTFSISKDLDIDNVKVSLNQGILSVEIPTKEVLKPRQIEVK